MVVMVVSRQRDVVQRLPWLSWPKVIPPRSHSVKRYPSGRRPTQTAPPQWHFRWRQTQDSGRMVAARLQAFRLHNRHQVPWDIPAIGSESGLPL
jgi:hypothetical protein